VSISSCFLGQNEVYILLKTVMVFIYPATFFKSKKKSQVCFIRLKWCSINMMFPFILITKTSCV